MPTTMPEEQTTYSNTIEIYIEPEKIEEKEEETNERMEAELDRQGFSPLRRKFERLPIIGRLFSPNKRNAVMNRAEECGLDSSVDTTTCNTAAVEEPRGDEPQTQQQVTPKPTIEKKEKKEKPIQSLFGDVLEGDEFPFDYKMPERKEVIAELEAEVIKPVEQEKLPIEQKFKVHTALFTLVGTVASTQKLENTTQEVSPSSGYLVMSGELAEAVQNACENQKYYEQEFLPLGTQKYKCDRNLTRLVELEEADRIQIKIEKPATCECEPGCECECKVSIQNCTPSTVQKLQSLSSELGTKEGKKTMRWVEDYYFKTSNDKSEKGRVI